jgi:hypothetical protein
LNPHARWARPSEDRVSACSTTWPMLPAARPASSPYGNRTRVPGLRGRNPEPLEERAVDQCVGQESNLHSNRGRVTAAWARRCPADTRLSVFPAGVEPAPRPSEGRMPPLHLGNVLASGPPGSRTPISALPRRRLPLGRAARVAGPEAEGERPELHRLAPASQAGRALRCVHPPSGPRRAAVPEAGFEPAVSCSRSRRVGPLRHSEELSWGAGGRTPTSWLTARLATVTTHPSSEHPAGVEPAHPAWEAGRLPLHHRCLSPRP